MAHIAKNDT